MYSKPPRSRVPGLGFILSTQGSGFRVPGLGFVPGTQDSGFRAQGIQGSGLRVHSKYPQFRDSGLQVYSKPRTQGSELKARF